MKEEIREQIEKLAHPDAQVREEAKWKLIDMGRVVVPHVLPLLEHKDPRVRWEATFILAELALPETAEALIKRLEDDRAEIRHVAITGLINIGCEAIEPLLKALVERGSRSPVLREGARAVLMELRESCPVVPLDELIHALKGVHEERIPEPTRVVHLAYELLKKLLVEGKHKAS